jgi:hypothetical protein
MTATTSCSLRRIIGIIIGGIAGAVTSGALSLVVGLALLELPYSLALAIVLAVILVVMGLLIIFSPAVRGSGAVRSAPWLERVVVSLIAVFAIAGGCFALVLFFKYRSIPAPGRLTM